MTITNTGSVAGKEVVEVYVQAPDGGLEKPARELRAFAKTRLLAPGESQTLMMHVDDYSLASFNESTNSWEAPSGVYEVMFGGNVCDIRRSAPYKMKKAKTWPVIARYPIINDGI